MISKDIDMKIHQRLLRFTSKQNNALQAILDDKSLFPTGITFQKYAEIMLLGDNWEEEYERRIWKNGNKKRK